jgi:hypothetical protein
MFFSLDLKEKDYLVDFTATYSTDKREELIQEIIGLISQSDKKFVIVLDGMDVSGMKIINLLMSAYRVYSELPESTN